VRCAIWPSFLSSVTLTHDPGSTFEYSNIGYGLLGHLLALKSGTNYETLVTSRVLKPQGMHNTAITLSHGMATRLAVGHDVMLQPVPKWDQSPAVAAGGALHSTANDLLTFLAAVLSGVDPAIRNATTLMLSAPRPTTTPNLKIGLGWHLLPFEGRNIVYYDGGTGGYRSFIGFDRETGTGVVVLSNTNSEADLNDIGIHLLDRRAVLLSFRPTASGDPALLDRYTGVYEVSHGFEIAIIRVGWLLFAKATGQPAFLLSAEGEGDFSIRDVDLTRPPTYRPEVALPTRYTFELDSTGRATALTRHEGARVTRGARVR
jgi:D-alanyl-D-alanine-carboxypeptidase/D-alanyl-D-alanine-endopeptidase